MLMFAVHKDIFERLCVNYDRIVSINCLSCYSCYYLCRIERMTEELRARRKTTALVERVQSEIIDIDIQDEEDQEIEQQRTKTITVVNTSPDIEDTQECVI